jgi:hypothetical protein
VTGPGQPHIEGVNFSDSIGARPSGFHLNIRCSERVHPFGDAGAVCVWSMDGQRLRCGGATEGDRMKKRLIARTVVSAGALCSLAAVLAAGTKWG